jgi:hypothetical protein
MPNAPQPSPILFVNGRKPARYNGRCKLCRKPHTALVVGGLRIGFVVDAVTDAAEILPLDCAGKPRRRCPCGASQSVQLSPVQGRFSAKHECNAKCLAATGHQCECSCGGKNHGAGSALGGALEFPRFLIDDVG